MNSSKGIFEGAPGSADGEAAAPSPFKAMSEGGDTASPFGAAGGTPSPFAVADDDDAKAPLEPGKPAKIPEPRAKPADEPSPFNLAEPGEGFGFEAADSGPAPFGASPFGAVPEQPAQAEATPVAEAKPAEKPVTLRPVESPPAAAAAPKAAAEPVPQAAAWSEPVGGGEIRQLELRAIFGVDRELSADEILQRLRSLAGIRNVVRVSTEGSGALDVLRRSLSGLAANDAPMRVSFGGAPVEFVDAGKLVLAVMNDGSFAPGVRETIIIAGRELARMS